jgi:cytochrome c
MNRSRATALAVLATLVIAPRCFAAEGNPTRGQRVFGACVACHSLQPGENMTGPSLAELWNRKAGSLSSFTRYSPALASANIVWNDQTLDDWIKDPQHLVPSNEMTFAGIKDTQQRADLLAFLKDATQKGGSQTAQQRDGSMGGMGGMMGGMTGGGKQADLKKLDPDQRVTAITYCKDTYTVSTGDGTSRKFWERNLRLMTDASGRGPEKKNPVILPAGMMGDRADVIFAEPGEISPFVEVKC